MWIFGACWLVELVRPEAGEHLVGSSPEHQRALSGHVAGRLLVELLFRNRPIEIAIARGEVTVGGDAVAALAQERGAGGETASAK